MPFQKMLLLVLLVMAAAALTVWVAFIATGNAANVGAGVIIALLLTVFWRAVTARR